MAFIAITLGVLGTIYTAAKIIYEFNHQHSLRFVVTNKETNKSVNISDKLTKKDLDKLHRVLQ